MHSSGTIYNQRYQIDNKEEHRDKFFLPLSLGNTARHPQLLHPATEELKTPGPGVIETRCTHTDIGVQYTRRGK
jgi:hypothetical protein